MFSPVISRIRQAERGEGDEGEIQNVIAAPMLAGDTLVGVITAVSFDAGVRFSSDDAALYARAASVAGVLVDQRRQLDLLSAGATDASGPLRDRIDGAIRRLVRSDPSRLEEVARLLESLEAIAATGDR